ncbi:MAG: 4-diphosphocytidyl-2-C-methyl-D-erythritol kinase [Turneriella sp.]|nr:4-diphosphocytidyl-2-C-methyl-D-erythritol kinase [Turneriella sp.]
MKNSTALFAPAKINLGLRITGRYANGYHRVESIFLPINIFDRLVVRESPHDAIFYKFYGSPGVQKRADFLRGVYKAPLLWNSIAMARSFLVKKEIKLPYVEITLHKRIPSPSGLGGASSDAASLLLYLWKSAYPGTHPSHEFITRAERLGADIPFFMRFGTKGSAAHLKGVGHELIGLKLTSPMAGWVCVPNFGFSTPQMYSAVRTWELPVVENNALEQDANTNLALRLTEIPYSDEPYHQVRLVTNDFDTVAEEVFPRGAILLKKAKYTLAEVMHKTIKGLSYVGMSGSGTALFAVTEAALVRHEREKIQHLLKARLGSAWLVENFFHSL